jgi:hypothetical protein
MEREALQAATTHAASAGRMPFSENLLTSQHTLGMLLSVACMQTSMHAYYNYSTNKTFSEFLFQAVKTTQL